jgi:hypothetical protein
MLWSPIVHEGYVTEKLQQIEGLELIINKEYTSRIQKLREQAKITSHDVGNPAFRLLQVLEHMKTERGA